MPAVTPLLGFFDIAERQYSSFTFDASARATVRNIIFAFCAGIILAALYMLYQKQVPGAIVRAILRAEAFSADKAKTARELGLAKNFFFRYELEHNLTLKRLIERVENENDDGETAETRYFIPEELKYRAEVRYDKKGNGLFGLILVVVVTVILGIVVIKLLPAVLTLFDNIIN